MFQPFSENGTSDALSSPDFNHDDFVKDKIIKPQTQRVDEGSIYRLFLPCELIKVAADQYNNRAVNGFNQSMASRALIA